METYFVAYNETTKYYLRKSEDEVKSRPRFRPSGEIVKFESLFEAVKFFEDSRFEMDKVEIRRINCNCTAMWTFDEALKERRKFFG